MRYFVILLILLVGCGRGKKHKRSDKEQFKHEFRVNYRH